MKKLNINIIQTAIFLVLTIGTFSCGEEQVFFPDVVPASEETASVKFVHGASDASGVHFYVNDLKVSSGAAAGSAINFAGSFPVVNYAALVTGSLPVKIAVPATATTAEIVLAAPTVAVESSKYYTIALAGVSPNYETVVFNDDVTGIAYDGKAYVRFVNLIHNSSNKVSVIAKLGTGAEFFIASNVAYKESVTFAGVDPGDYTIKLVDAVDNTIVLATITDVVLRTLLTNKVYTLFARGQIGQTAPRAPVLDRMINR